MKSHAVSVQGLLDGTASIDDLQRQATRVTWIARSSSIDLNIDLKGK